MTLKTVLPCLWEISVSALLLCRRGIPQTFDLLNLNLSHSFTCVHVWTSHINCIKWPTLRKERLCTRIRRRKYWLGGEILKKSKHVNWMSMLWIIAMLLIIINESLGVTYLDLALAFWDAVSPLITEAWLPHWFHYKPREEWEEINSFAPKGSVLVSLGCSSKIP